MNTSTQGFLFIWTLCTISMTIPEKWGNPSNERGDREGSPQSRNRTTVHCLKEQGEDPVSHRRPLKCFSWFTLSSEWFFYSYSLVIGRLHHPRWQRVCAWPGEPLTQSQPSYKGRTGDSLSCDTLLLLHFKSESVSCPPYLLSHPKMWRLHSTMQCTESDLAVK